MIFTLTALAAVALLIWTAAAIHVHPLRKRLSVRCFLGIHAWERDDRIDEVELEAKFGRAYKGYYYERCGRHGCAEKRKTWVLGPFYPIEDFTASGFLHNPGSGGDF